jgi:tetratricopeptide (TPR) repeat protein
MKLTRSNISRTALFMVLVVCGLLQLKIALFEQSRFSKPRPHSRLWRQQINPANLTAAAGDASLFQGRSDKARRLLQRALTLDPLYIPAWITLSELEIYLGKENAARKILTYIDSRMVEVSRWRWRKTMLAYQLGDQEILARDLGYAVAEIPQHRQQALDLAAALWPAAETRLEKIGAANLLHLFRYSLRPERLEAALVYWPEVCGEPELELRYRLRFIELLRRAGKLQLARTIWRQEMKTDAILFNGNFAVPPLQTAFGWRVGKTVGSSWEFIPPAENEPSAFHLHFTGSENVNYHHLMQYFIPPPDFNQDIYPEQTPAADQTANLGAGPNSNPNSNLEANSAANPESELAPAAAPGRSFTLTGQARCKNLTTNQRPYFEIVGVNAKQPRVHTPMFAANQDLAEFSFNFIVPPGCEQVYVRLRRNKSNDINCLIAGDIWLSNLKIRADGLTND